MHENNEKSFNDNSGEQSRLNLPEQVFKENESGKAPGDSASLYKNLSFQALIENAPDGLTLIDSEGNFKYISTAAKRIFGYQPDEDMPGSPVGSTHPDDIEIVIQTLRKVIENPLFVPTIQYRFKNRDNTWRWIESAISNMLSIPEINSIVFNFSDISERKQAEEKVSKSEEKFRMLLELATDAFFQGNRDGKFITVNSKASELTGYSRDELLQMNINQLFTDGELDRKPLDYIKLISGETIKIERSMKRKDNSFVEIEMHSRAMPDGTYQSFFRDITLRKNAEKDLLKQRRFFEQMFLQSATSTQILDPEGWCVRINPKLSELFGVQPENLEGSVYNIFKDSELKKAGIDKLLRNVFDNHEVETWEIFFDIGAAADSQGIKVEDNKIAWFNNKAYPIFDEDGSLMNVIIQHEDITERKVVEEALKIKEEQLLTLINTTHDIICFKDGNGRWLKANKADLDLFGLQEIDYYLKTDAELAGSAHPIFKDAFLNCGITDEKAWQAGISTIEDEIIPTTDGNERAFEIIKTPLFNADGTRKGLVVFGRDITERKSAELALRESENKYRQIVDYLPDAIAIHTEKEFLYTNPAALKLIGARNLEEINEKTLFEYIHPEEKQSTLDRIKRIINSGNPEGFIEQKIIRLDGSQVDVEIIGIPIQYMGRTAVQAIIRDISERKITINALRESEDKFRTLAESAPYAIMIYQDDHWIYTNPAGEQLSGYTAEELYNMPFWELAADEYRDLIRKRGQSRQTGQKATPSYEFKIKHKSQADRWVYLSGSSVLYKGKYAGIISVIDITERKQAEEAIQRERKLLRTLIDNLPDTIYFKDKDCRRIVSNRADLQILGISDETEALGKTDIDLMGETLGRNGFADDQTVINTGFPMINSEEEFIDGEGKLHWMLTSKIPLHDENGHVNGLVGIGHDITLRKQSEQIQRVLFQISNAVITTSDLEQLFLIIREQLGTLLDTTNFYIAFYDEKTDMLSSPYFSDEKDDIPVWPAGKSATGYVIKQNKSLLADVTEIERLEREGVIEIVGEICSKWLGVPLVVDGKAIGALVVQSYHNPDAYSYRDVEMLEFVSHQISLSIQRKKAEQDLRDALAKAEESDRLKTAFLNNMSHEIRTPLNGILGFTSLLDDPDTTPQDQQYFYRIINQNGEQLLSIINDIINIATIEAGQEKIRESTTNINAMMGMMFEQFKLQCASKQLMLNFKSSLSEEESLIRTDDTKLKQILTNLIGNAIKFTDHGLVEFGCNKSGSMLEFFVSDTGIGIPEDKHSIIFERFRQVNLNPKKEYGGNGLGLAITKAYVELLGGSIWLESVTGKGSTFRFSIPFHKVNHPFSVSDPGKPPTQIVSGVGHTLLIAEDVYANFQLLETILKKLNYNIIHVENGLEAIEAVMNNPAIDLVLMDLKMPEMDGFEATRQIKAFKPDLPIVAVTAYALGGDKEKALRAGCDDYIAKPVKVGILLEILKRFQNKLSQKKDL